REVSFVFQETHLLRMSIADNIGYAKRSCGRSAIENAATMARAHGFITSLPRGYDSIVGEDIHLSGGEAQRIAIARAILADTPILVLDEATSFADPECEAEIQQALSELIRHRTTLVIAHRLQTVTDADQICVMDQGRLVERGRHSDLVMRGGLYATMWDTLTSEHDAPREVAE
ncbi:MAG: ATP-binding cassette domain-containing protein, partial [Pseudomonadota bacterium]